MESQQKKSLKDRLKRSIFKDIDKFKATPLRRNNSADSCSSGERVIQYELLKLKKKKTEFKFNSMINKVVLSR